MKRYSCIFYTKQTKSCSGACYFDHSNFFNSMYNNVRCKHGIIEVNWIDYIKYKHKLNRIDFINEIK